MNRVMLTQAEAKAIVDAYEIRDDDEDGVMLQEHNPILYQAFQRLLKIADGQ